MSHVTHDLGAGQSNSPQALPSATVSGAVITQGQGSQGLATLQDLSTSNTGTQQAVPMEVGLSTSKQQPSGQQLQQPPEISQQTSSAVASAPVQPSIPPPSATNARDNSSLQGQQPQQRQPPVVAQPSPSIQGHFDVKFASQSQNSLPKQDALQRQAQLKALPKKEKVQCLFCTKPARLTCPHKLCKKCCNERHPNDCKAHDSGTDKEKSKPARTSAFATLATPSMPLTATPKPWLGPAETSQAEVPILRGIAPGANAVNLSEAAHAYNQDMQELAHWQTVAYEQLDQQQRQGAEEAMQRYVFNANLLREICQGSASSAMHLPTKGASWHDHLQQPELAEAAQQDSEMQDVGQQQSLVDHNTLQDTQSNQLAQQTADVAKLKDSAPEAQSAKTLHIGADEERHHLDKIPQRSCIVL